MRKSNKNSQVLFSKESLPFDLHTLETVLRPYILKQVYKYRLSHWYGSEKDIVDDVLSETFVRALPYVQRAANGAISPIRSFEALCKTIALNCLLDLRRKDKHLAFSIDALPCYHEYQYSEPSGDPAEGVIEDMLVYAKMQLIAKTIIRFSPKLKEAMLVHFANIADLDDEFPCPLQRALWSVGIPLREYRREIHSAKLRSRQASLVCLGHKLLREMANSSYTQPPDRVA